MSQSLREKRNDLLGEKVVKALQSRNFEAYYCKTSQDAIKKVLEFMHEKSSVTWGGSDTIRSMGLTKQIHEKDYIVYDRDLAATPEEMQDIYRKTFYADYYLTSVNAIAENGVMINIDRTGNRLAAICFGPKHVIIVAGINKVEATEEAALLRARTKAAPINAMRFDIKTPCKLSGSCGDCKSPESICSKILTLRLCDFPGRIKVVLVGEDLGY